MACILRRGVRVISSGFLVNFEPPASYLWDMDTVMETQDAAEILVRKAQAGDRKAFERLAEGHRGRVASLLRARLGEVLRSRLDIDDLLQEVFLRACSHLRDFQWSGDDSFFRWLSGIARNVVHEAARREKRELILPLDDRLEAPLLSGSRALAREDRFERLKAAIGRLKPEHRDVILLARIRRLPMGEVAERLGRTPDAAVQLLRRALKSLKDEFGDTESLGLPDRSILKEGLPPGEGRRDA